MQVGQRIAGDNGRGARGGWLGRAPCGRNHDDYGDNNDGCCGRCQENLQAATRERRANASALL